MEQKVHDTASAAAPTPPVASPVPAYRVPAGAPLAEVVERVWTHWSGGDDDARPPAALVLAAEADCSALADALRARVPAATPGERPGQERLLRFLRDGGATWIAGGPAAHGDGAAPAAPALCCNAALSERLLRHLAGATSVLLVGPWEPNASVAREHAASLREIPVATPPGAAAEPSAHPEA